MLDDLTSNGIPLWSETASPERPRLLAVLTSASPVILGEMSVRIFCLLSHFTHLSVSSFIFCMKILFVSYLLGGVEDGILGPVHPRQALSLGYSPSPHVY